MPLLDAVRLATRLLHLSRVARWSPDRVRAVQAHRFRRTVRLAAERTPFYRDKFRGIDLAKCTLADLPVTTKVELMARFDDALADPSVRRADLERFVDDSDNVGRLFQGRYPVCHTSGSQGQPLFVVQDRQALDLLFALQVTRGNPDYRFGLFEPVRRAVRPGRIAIVIGRPGFFPSAWAWQHLPAVLRPYIRLLYTSAGDPDLLGKLAAFRPTVLTSTPTTLDNLALKADRLRLPDLKQVVAWSETLTDAARSRIGTAFRVPVLDTYGCGECLFLSNGCPAGPGTHVNADWVILEVVDEAYRPVADGTMGQRVLLTNLANEVQPLIRYDLGDRVTMATTPCGCGSRLPRIERVDGRSGDVFWVRVGSEHRPLTGYPFQHAFEHLRGVREWRATQRERNRIEVRFEMLPGAVLDEAEARRRLAERLTGVGLCGAIDVEMTVVDRLAADPATGKFRRLVTTLGRPA